ncbi:MAG: hypothetical protein ACXVDF_16475 [Ktedonobacterales bacterium]
MPLTTTTPTPTVVAATPTQTALPTADATTRASCGFSPTETVTLVGGLAINAAHVAHLAYPSWTLPDNTPLKPLAVNYQTQNPFPDLPPSNPGMREVGGGFDLLVCNTTQTVHTLTGVSVQIAFFQAYSGKLNAWNWCDHGIAFNAQNGSVGGGCGGGDFANEWLHATFAPDAMSGTTVVATQTGTGSAPGDPSPFPPLPYALVAHKTVTVAVGVTVPTAPGIYRFALGLSVDGEAPIFYSTSEPYLFAPVAQQWGGIDCTDPAMKAQIPAATTPTYYICPMSTK